MELARSDIGLVAIGSYAAALIGRTARPRDIDFVHDFSARTLETIVEIMKKAGAEYVPLVETKGGYFEPEKKPADYDTNPDAQRIWDDKTAVRLDNFTNKPGHMRFLTQYRIGDEIIDFFAFGGNDPYFSFDHLMERAHEMPYGNAESDGFFYTACLDDMAAMAKRLMSTGPERYIEKNRRRHEELVGLKQKFPAGYPVNLDAQNDPHLLQSLEHAVRNGRELSYHENKALEAAVAARTDMELLALQHEVDQLAEQMLERDIRSPSPEGSPFTL